MTTVCVCVSERLWSTGLQPLFLNLCLLPERRHCSKTVPGTVCTTSVFMKRVQIRSTMIFLTSSSSSGSIGCKCSSVLEVKVCVVDIFFKKMSLWSKTECRLNKIDVSHFFFFFCGGGGFVSMVTGCGTFGCCGCGRCSQPRPRWFEHL